MMTKTKYLILFFLVVATPLFAQKKQIADTSVSHYSWELINNFSQINRVEKDTLLTDFQINNPIFRSSISHTYLGAVGTAFLSNDFSQRLDEPEFIPTKVYFPYFFIPENTLYYNTKVPITRLYYSNGGSSENKEDILKAFHTQNITPDLNFGLDYYLISSKGQFKYTNVKMHAFKFFGSYTKPKYKLHFNYNLNRYTCGESGGVVDTVFQDAEYQFPKAVSTRLGGTGNPYYKANASNKVRYYDILVSQNLRLFRIGAKADSAKPKEQMSMAEPVLSHVIRYSRNAKIYSDADPVSPGFYPVVFINPLNTYDSVSQKKLTNTVQLEFKTLIKQKIQTGIYVSLTNELNWYNFYTPADTGFVYDPSDTTIQHQYFQYFMYNNGDTLFPVNENRFVTNTFVKGGIYGDFWKTISGRFNAMIYINGYKAGETRLDGVLTTKFRISQQDYLVKASAIVENKVANYLYNNYYSNHFIWENSFKPTLLTHLSGTFSGLSNNLELNGNYSLIRNLIYFNTLSQPDQYDQTISVLSLHLKKRFKFWKFYSLNEMIYQVTDNTNIISIPDFAYRNSTYFWHTFNFRSTGGKLEVMLGADLYYHTEFSSMAYMPSISQYYQQNEYKTGNFPVIDFFLNLRLKRVKFFCKLEHANSSWWDKNYFSTIHYPRGERMFKYGLSWSFFD